MAQVTVELRNLLKTDFELFDFDYHFDDKEFKKELEQAVIDYYYFYEICDMPDRFKHYFKSRWLRMIGGINELYNTTLIKYDILSNYSLTEALEQISINTRESNKSTDSTGNTQMSSNSTSKSSDYPQQPLAGGDYLAEESNTVVDSRSSDSANTKENTTAHDESNMTYRKTIEGITGTSYPELIAKHRENIINIKQMVIDEMKPCFILVY